MVEIVLKDWIGRRKEAFREAWENIGFSLIMILVQGVIWSGNFTNYNFKEQIPIFCEVLMFAIMLLFHYMYPNKLAKTMFFLPIEEKEKKRYLLTGYFMKIVIVTLLHIAVTSIICAFDGISPEGAGLSTVSLLLCNVSMGLQNTVNDKEATMVLVTWIVSGVLYMLFLSIGKSPMEFREKIVMLFCLALQAFVCLRKLRKRFRDSMEKAVNYEAVYGIKEEKRR